MKKKENTKQRLFEMMGKLDPTFKPKLNESAFNDAGEPTMTHQQYRDYSEPSEPDYDNQDEYEEEQTPKSIVKEIEKHFNTILETYNGREYTFLTSDNNQPYLFFYNNKVKAEIGDGKIFPETNIDELDINDLFNFFEPYRQYILSGGDAERAMNKIYSQNAADDRYASQERSAMGGNG